MPTASERATSKAAVSGWRKYLYYRAIHHFQSLTSTRLEMFVF
jgi:hypothetical protein